MKPRGWLRQDAAAAAARMLQQQQTEFISRTKWLENGAGAVHLIEVIVTTCS